MARANDFFHRARANSTMLPARMARPITAGISNAAVAWPVIASRATAMTGRPSLRNAFQMPVVVMSRAICEPVKPQE